MKHQSAIDTKPSLLDSLYRRLPAWIRCRTFYVASGVTLLAGILRMYRLDEGTTLDVDQTTIFRLAHDALLHATIPLTTGATSIGSASPPGAVYLMLLPAALSANPFWGALWLALLATFSVTLTFLFTRRYYGWFAGISAALLYATAHRAVAYARYIWQPNLMPFFVILFFWMLFRGVVERRSGWLVPAVALISMILQLHLVAAPLLIPLILAWLLAPGTVRGRDIILSLSLTSLLWTPFLIYLLATHGRDLSILLSTTHRSGHLSKQVFTLYQTYISPYDGAEPAAGTLVAPLHPLLNWLLPTMLFLLTSALILVLWLILFRTQTKLHNRWSRLQANPERCGLLLLLAWQLAPLLIFTYHSVPLFRQYLLFTLPGQFILIGWLLSRVGKWCRRQRGRGRYGQMALYALTLLLVLAQGLGSAADDLDQVRGHFRDLYTSTLYHSDLASMQNAINAADQLAQQRHLNHVYVATDTTNNGMEYLSEQMRTPSSTFDALTSVLIPGPHQGSAAVLLGPHDTLAASLLTRFAHALLIATFLHRGGPPYQLYIVPSVEESPGLLPDFSRQLQLQKQSALHLSSGGSSYLVTCWSLLQPVPAAYRKTVRYTLTMTTAYQHQAIAASTTLSAIRAGDRLLVAWQLPLQMKVAPPILVRAQYAESSARLFHFGPFTFDSGFDALMHSMSLTTAHNQRQLALP